MNNTIYNIMEVMRKTIQMSNQSYRWLLLCLVGMMMSSGAYATHIVGGDFTYRQLGPETFEVSLTIRRDCFNGAEDAEFDTTAVIAIYYESGGLAEYPPLGGYLKIPFMGSDTLDNVLISDCGFIGSQVCVHEALYRDTIQLADLGDGYVLGYTRCCRNGTLNNVVDPLNTGTTEYITIPQSVFSEPNSSPVFNAWPDLYICANQELTFDHSATDADGDELRYKLYTPKQGADMNFPNPQGATEPPYEDVDWASPYNLDNLMGGTPLTIDENTGVITAVPNTVGQFLIGIAVEEYRNGVKIGETRRDFEYNVRNCEAPPVAGFDVPTDLCAGNVPVEFNNTSSGASSYQWFFDFPNMDPAFTSTEENPTFSYPEEGTYNVKLLAFRGSDIDDCFDEFDATITVITADIDVNFKSFIGTCGEGENITLALNSTSTDNAPNHTIIDWQYTIEQDGNVQSVSGANVEVDIDEAGSDPIVTLVVTSSSGCSASATQTIDLDNLDPIADFSFSAMGCPTPETLQFTLTDISNTVNPDYTSLEWVWTVVSNEGTQTLNGPSITLALDPFQIITATLDVTFTNGCTATITKEINLEDSLPQGDILTELISCIDNNLASFLFTDISGEIAGNPSNAVSWEWIVTLDDGTELSSTDQTIQFDANPFQTASVDLLISFENGCIARVVQEVNLEDLLPYAAYDLEAVACSDDGFVDVVFTDTSTSIGGATPVTIEWMIGPISDINAYSGSPVSLTIPKDSLIYITQIVNFDNGCIDTLSESIIPGPFASLDFNGNPVFACLGTETHLLNNPNPDWTYTWDPNTGLDFTNGNHDPIFVGTENTTYNVTVTDGLCTETGTIDVVVADMSNLMVTGDLFSCEGLVDLTASGGFGEGEYQWALADDPSMIIFTGTNLVTTFEGESVTYIITFTGTDCPIDPLEVTVGQLDVDIELIDPYQMCAGDSIAYIVLNNDPSQILTYVWEDDPHITSGGDTDSPVIEVGEDETEPFELPFSVTNQFGCTTLDTLNIIIADIPVLSFEGTLTECGELEMCFSVTSDIFGFAIWDFGDPTTTDDTAIDMEPCYTYPDFGTYTVTLSNISGICQAEPVSMDITINPQIVATDIEDQQVCAGDEVTLEANTNLEDFDAIWCTVDGDTLFTGNPYTFTAQSDIDVILKVSDVNNCSDTVQVAVDVFDFDLDVQFPEVFCGESEVPVTVVNNSDGDLTYLWGPEDCVISGGETATPVLTAAGDSKQFTLQVTNNETGCTMTFTYDIPVNDFQVEVDADPDTTINQGEEVDIFVVDSDPNHTYIWDNGSNEAEQTVMPLDTTTYTVTVTDENGCTDTASITINVREPKCDDTDVFLPTAFSPNDDGVNDLLFVRSNFIESMELTIYNRWGEEVFRTTDQTIPWDGTYQGEKLAPDVYAYILNVVCINSVDYNKKGNVSILR